jgi:hypothetical protein
LLFIADVEIGQLNKKIIKVKKKDVTVRIIALSKEDETDIIGAFRPVKNDVRLFNPQLDDHRGFGDLDDLHLPGFVRWVLIDRREILLSAGADEGVPGLDSANAIWVSNASIAQLMMRPVIFDRAWELAEQINTFKPP